MIFKNWIYRSILQLPRGFWINHLSDKLWQFLFFLIIFYIKKAKIIKKITTFEFQKIEYDFSFYQFKVFNVQALFRLKFTRIDNITAYTF